MAQLLQERKATLNPVTEMSTPHTDAIKIVRDGTHAKHKTGAAFVDFAVKTRRDLTLLAATQSGQEIFSTIEKSGHEVSIQDRGLNTKHGGSHMALDRVKAMTPDVGSSSLVTHQTDRSKIKPRPHAAPTSSTISLGHELIHSTHSATGTLQEGTHDPVGRHKHGVKKEEQTTVGDPSGARPKPGQPTENTLRADLAKQHAGITGVSGAPIVRTKYGKKALDFGPTKPTKK